MAKGIVVYGFPAIGKTTICKNYSNFLDLESSDFQWLFTPEQMKMSAEERKGLDKVKNPAWPQNYYDAIDKAREKYDYIFVAFAGIEHCLNSKIDYWRIYPTLDQKEDYLKRMSGRGNSEQFVKTMSEKWEMFIKGCSDDKVSTNIEMKKGEFLEDCLKRIGVINQLENEDDGNSI